MLVEYLIKKKKLKYHGEESSYNGLFNIIFLILFINKLLYILYRSPSIIIFNQQNNSLKKSSKMNVNIIRI